jgi:hypothetical protein
MRFPGQLPCLEVLLVASFIFKLQIRVYFWSAEPIVYQDCRTDLTSAIVIYLQCLGGIYFNALIEQDGFVPQSCEQLTEVVVPLDPEVSLVNQVKISAMAESDERVACPNCIPSRHPRIILKIAGYDVCGILDTGAETSLIRQGIFDKINQKLGAIPCNEARIVIEGFSGRLGSVRGSVDLHVQLPANMVSFIHTFGIVNDNLIPNCMLLGIDFMAAHGLSISGHLNECSQDLECELQRVQLLCVGVVALQESTPVAMSCRCRKASPIREHVPITLSTMLEWQSIAAKQEDDPTLQELRRMTEDQVPKAQWLPCLESYKFYKVDFLVWEKLLFCQQKQQPQPVVVVPGDTLVEVALTLHVSMAHLGRDKMVHLLRQHLCIRTFILLQVTYVPRVLIAN